MRRSRLWLFLLIAGIMTMTTVYYVTVMGNAKTNYTNGRMVENENIIYTNNSEGIKSA